MKVINLADTTPEQGEEGCHGMVVRWLIAENDGAKNFVMRVFEIQPGSAIPSHNHPWEHELFVVSGNGTFISGDSSTSIKDGDAIMVLPDESHNFMNTGNDILRIICIVPLVDGKMPGLPVTN